MNLSASKSTLSLGIISHIIHDIQQVLERIPIEFFRKVLSILKSIFLNIGLVFLIIIKLSNKRKRRNFIRNLTPVLIAAVDNFFR